MVKAICTRREGVAGSVAGWDNLSLCRGPMGGPAQGKDTTLNGFLTSRDGTHLFYEVSGEGKPLLFCYGLVCRREHWRHQIRHLSQRYRIITFDYRAHHRSSKPANDRHLTLDWCANDAQDIVRYLELEEVVCLGHSMGVPVAAKLATLEPDRFKGLILVCGSLTNPFKNMFFSERMDSIFKLYAMLYETAPQTLSWMWKQFTSVNPVSFFLTSRLGFNSELAQRTDVLSYMEGVHETPLKVFYSLIKNYTEFEGTALLERIACPTLVVAGEEDCITPMALHEDMVKRLPRGKLGKIPGGSHNAHLDKPEETNRLIDEFLREIGYE